MKKVFLAFAILFFVNVISFAQDSGNRIYGNRGYYNQNKRQPMTNTGVLTSAQISNQYSIEASVLMNLKADAFVAVFGINEVGDTSAVSNEKVNAKIMELTRAVNTLGIRENDIYTDFITQTRVYDYAVQGSQVTEKLSGFETKKTLAIKYKSRDLFEKILAAAAKVQIFDLIKVDYIVSDFEAVQARLFDEATKIIKSKEAKYINSFNVKLNRVGLGNEKYDAFYPADNYERYQAFETGEAYYQSGAKVTQRKSFTFFYEPLSASRFDKTINPIGVEPVVQFTLYLKMNYDAGNIEKK